MEGNHAGQTKDFKNLTQKLREVLEELEKMENARETSFVSLISEMKFKSTSE